MSFSTDLDAVRERAGISTVFRIECRRHRKAEHIITIDPKRADRFLGQHAMTLRHLSPHVTYLEGPGRFRIKRFPLGSSTDPVWPWRVTDADRPGVFGRARTHAAAIELVDLMRAKFGEHAVVEDGDGETVAYITGKVVHPVVGVLAVTHDRAPLQIMPGSLLDCANDPLLITVAERTDEPEVDRRRCRWCGAELRFRRHYIGCPDA